MTIGSYGKILAVGNKYIAELLVDDVVVQEKVDGSQFSFMVKDGELFCRSKNKGIIPDAPDQMFRRGVESVQALAPLLTDSWVYRGEYLNKPCHNALAYDRVPNGHVIIFDIERGSGTQDYLNPQELAEEATRIGLESVPVLWAGKAPTDYNEFLQGFLKSVSILGGQRVEGIVIKNYSKPDADGKLLKGKIVSDDFKEVHKVKWGESNPSKGDKVQRIVEAYRQPTRWHKAIQHLAEEGILTETPKDIGALMKEVNNDILTEEVDNIKELLWTAFQKDIMRGVTAGLPEWYKRKLLGMPLEGDEVVDSDN